MGAAMLLCGLSLAGVLAVETGVFSASGGHAGRMTDFSAGFVAGQASTIPLQTRIRMENGWIVGVARVTGPRHLRVGDHDFRLAFVSPANGALRELERLAQGQWVACVPLGSRGDEANCATEGAESLSHALIWSGKARATHDAPLGLRVADSMKWKD